MVSSAPHGVQSLLPLGFILPELTFNVAAPGEACP